MGDVLFWESKLEAGERVRLFGSTWFYLWVIPFTAAAVYLLYSFLAVIIDFMTGRPSQTVSNPQERFLILVFFPGWALGLTYLWRHLFYSGIQFTATGFYFWDWRGKCHFIEYTDVVALEWGPSMRRPDKVVVHLVGKAQGRSSWKRIRVDRSRNGLTEAIKNMVERRCGLTESDSPERPEEATLLWKPGKRNEFRPGSGWLN